MNGSLPRERNRNGRGDGSAAGRAEGSDALAGPLPATSKRQAAMRAERRITGCSVAVMGQASDERRRVVE
jgi:hypothetical protein